jgi:hypothetical protein
MASVYVKRSLLLDVNERAFALIISAFAEILTLLLVMPFKRGGWYDCLPLAAIR